MQKTSCGVHHAPERPAAMCQSAMHGKHLIHWELAFLFTEKRTEFLVTCAHYTTLVVVGDVALGDINSSSPDLHTEASHKEEKRVNPVLLR